MRIPTYLQRRWMRWMEGSWARLEALLNRVLTPAFNPFYHLGTLALFLLMVLAVTGIYLTVFYRPGAARAYETTLGISQTALGLWMRTIHRYAADGLLLVVVLHALKMFLSERFAAARWVAWLTGWLLTLLIWAIGVMGYWLLWDQTAQWITEFLVQVLGPSMALTFLGPDVASKSFAFFVIVLFLHIFLSVLIVLGFLLHILRLSRPRWLAPRWLMVQAGLVLSLLAVMAPAYLEPKADFSRILHRATVDWFYLAFLPLSERWGAAFWWGTAGALAVLLVLPWLLPDRHPGPARIVEHLCTGCGLGALKCPYQAIELVPRGEESAFKFMASIRPNLCVGCGLCLGTCAVISIDLDARPTQDFLQEIRQAVAQAKQQRGPVVMAVTCQRHLALGSLPVPTPTLPAATAHRVTVNGTEASVVLVALPCVGMLNPEWIRPFLQEGEVQGVGVLSCPTQDCGFREGPFWLAQNLKYRRNLLSRPFFWVEAAPGERRSFFRLVRALTGASREAPSAADQVAHVLETREGKRFPRALGTLVASFAAVLLLLGVSRAAIQPVARAAPPAGIRILMAHTGQIKAVGGDLSAELQTKLPPGVTASQVLGGERYPVHLRVEVDGQVVLERMYEPSGFRREGLAYAFENLALKPGVHQIRLSLMDDGRTWRVVFNDQVDVTPGSVLTLIFDDEQGRFVLVPAFGSSP